MRKLLPRQRAFVRACLETGRNNNTLHARMAGYSGNDDSMKATGWRLAHDADVQAAMLEEAEKRLRGNAIMATSTLVNLAENAREDKDKLKAIDMLLNRAGLHAKTEHKVTVEHHTPADMIARIEHLAAKLGLDPVKLLGHSSTAVPAAGAEIIDAEFAEVSDGGEPETGEGEIQW